MHVNETETLLKANARTARLRAAFVRRYPTVWNGMIRSWTRPQEASACRMWLMYAANYLLATGGVRWAVDPLLPGALLPELRCAGSARALHRLSFLLLTHDHTDHADYGLLARLRDSDVRFVVPEAMLELVAEQDGVRDSQIIVARPGRRIEIDGIEALPFEGLHWRTHPDGQHAGIDATGYLVKVGGKRWLFPGDVRDYDAEAASSLAPVDLLFSHLWLGKGCAIDETPPEVDRFCDFILATGASDVILTHLREFSRPPRELWRVRHARLVRARCNSLDPGTRIHFPRIGQAFDLDPAALSEPPERATRQG